MARRIKVECTSTTECKFSDKCVIVNPVKTLDPNDAGGDFWPIWQIRTIKNKMEVRCFSFDDKGGLNGNR